MPESGWPVTAGNVMPVPCSIAPTPGTVAGISVGAGGPPASTPVVSFVADGVVVVVAPVSELVPSALVLPGTVAGAVV